MFLERGERWAVEVTEFRVKFALVTLSFGPHNFLFLFYVVLCLRSPRFICWPINGVRRRRMDQHGRLISYRAHVFKSKYLKEILVLHQDLCSFSPCITNYYFKIINYRLKRCVSLTCCKADLSVINETVA